jgi:hypothetical protein
MNATVENVKESEAPSRALQALPMASQMAASRLPLPRQLPSEGLSDLFIRHPISVLSIQLWFSGVLLAEQSQCFHLALDVLRRPAG